jgi:hypothetical protein
VLSTPPAFVLSQDQTLQTKTPHHNRQGRISNQRKPDKTKQQNHTPTRGIKAWQKNNNKNKTTKHTIEFSNNTRKQATLPLYSAAQAPSTALTIP